MNFVFSCPSDVKKNLNMHIHTHIKELLALNTLQFISLLKSHSSVQT